MRQIYRVNAYQCVVSENHPEGVFSNIPNYPIQYDSRNYAAPDGNPNGNSDTALICAQAEFADEVKALTVAANPNRVMWCVTIEAINGTQIVRKSWGSLPDMTPPEPEPEEADAE